MSGIRLDGRQVAEDLERNTSLWSAAVTMGGGLIPLRDLSSGKWNADTIYVLSSQEDDEALFALASGWNPDEANWIEGADADELLGWHPSNARILQLWWD